jgi:hypothetical protein
MVSFVEVGLSAAPWHQGINATGRAELSPEYSDSSTDRIGTGHE